MTTRKKVKVKSELSIRDVRAELPRIDALLAETGEVLITRRGTPIARLLPLHTKASMPSHAKLRASMPRLAAGSETLIRQDRDER